MRPVKERMVILNPDGRFGDYWSAIGNGRTEACQREEVFSAMAVEKEALM